MANRVIAWYRELSKIGKTGVIATGVVGFLTVAGATADQPVVTTKTETKTTSVPFTTTYQDDDTLLTSESKLITPGVAGTKLVSYKVTYSGTKETKRFTTAEVVQKQPIPQVSARGTKELTNIVATESIPFGSTTVNDSNLAKGSSQVTTVGANGSKAVTYEVIKLKGKEVSRKVAKEEVTLQPVTQVTAVGTKVPPKVAVTAPKAVTPPKTSSNCDPNYSGGCVPIASDVDCGGGSGNGPAYFYGTAHVIGSDIYDLDRDHDGLACE